LGGGDVVYFFIGDGISNYVATFTDPTDYSFGVDKSAGEDLVWVLKDMEE
jgi:hypothetical protein